MPSSTSELLAGLSVATIAETLVLAQTYHQSGNLRQAEQLYRRILAAEPAHAETCYLLGAACQALGNPDEAIEHLCQAVAGPAPRLCRNAALSGRCWHNSAGSTKRSTRWSAR